VRPVGLTWLGVSEDPRRRLGARGEKLAARHLERRGYGIVDRNFRTRYGELDLIAADESFLVFCEVKTRVVRAPPGPLGPLTAVGASKQRQLRRMAREWLAARSGGLTHRPAELRFDAIGVSLDGRGELVVLEHVEGAF
jgi:putative endonuclease